MGCKKIGIVSFKGGVAKTSSAVNIAAGIKNKNPEAKVLLVDADPQGSRHAGDELPHAGAMGRASGARSSPACGHRRSATGQPRFRPAAAAAADGQPVRARAAVSSDHVRSRPPQRCGAAAVRVRGLRVPRRA